MDLAFELLLTLFIQLPIIALFFKQKKRPVALSYGMLVNFIAWPVVHILKMSTDINIYIIEMVVVLSEGISFWLLTKCTWQRGFSMSVIANVISFIVLKIVHFQPDMFQNRPNIIIH